MDKVRLTQPSHQPNFPEEDVLSRLISGGGKKQVKVVIVSHLKIQVETM